VTLGELYVILGFKVEGSEDMKQVSKDLDDTVRTATKLALGVDLVTTGLAVMIHTAVEAAVGFHQFELATGLSSEKLQQWNYRAALANVSAQEMMQTIEGLQKAGIKAATTGEGMQPWVLLGIDPRQNPFTVLSQLGRELQSIDQRRVALARQITEQAGIPRDVFAMLRQPDPGNLPGRHILTDEQQQKLMGLNREWERLGFLITQDKNILSSEMAPQLTRFVTLLERGVDAAAKMIGWLGNHPNVARWMVDATVAATAMASAFLTVVGAAKGLATAITLVNSAFVPEIIALGIVTSAVLGLADAYLVLKSAKDHSGDANRQHLGAAGRSALSLPDQQRSGSSYFEWMKNHPTDNSVTGARTSSISQTNTFHITESGDVSRTKRGVIDALGAQLQGAGYSAEAPNY
jgi:hypothetical protein